jgi:hypothetical protein
MGRSKTPDELLFMASCDGDVAGVEGALAAGADIEARSAMEGMTALMLAAFNGHDAAVSVLLGKGADPDASVDDDRAQEHAWGVSGLWLQALWFAAHARSKACYKLLDVASGPPCAEMVKACQSVAGKEMGIWIERWNAFERDQEALEAVSLTGAAAAKNARL